ARGSRGQGPIAAGAITSAPLTRRKAWRLMAQEQRQYQGAERRQSQSQYQGDDRRKPDPIFEQTTWIPGNDGPGMDTQPEKDEQQAERIRQQKQKDHDPTRRCSPGFGG